MAFNARQLMPQLEQINVVLVLAQRSLGPDIVLRNFEEFEPEVPFCHSLVSFHSFIKQSEPDGSRLNLGLHS